MGTLKLLAEGFAIRESESKRVYLMLKRFLDIIGTSILISAAWPLAGIAACLVAFDLGRPLLFRQVRVGRDGKTFEILKFRTLPHKDQRCGDGRSASRIGQALRRSRLDELPQLYNVIRGDMALVGPRPLVPTDLCPRHLQRLQVRPGITGWAQVHGGREVNATDKAALDAWYVAHASIALDISILTRTIPFLLKGDRRDQQAITIAWRELALQSECDARQKSDRAP